VIVVLGINHNTASVELRESLAFSEEQARTFVAQVMQEGSVAEVFILSTCNRTEVHFVTENPKTGQNTILNSLASACGRNAKDYAKSLYDLEGREAVEHIFSVTAGLNSMVLGETEILGQVKKAYQLSDQGGGIGATLHGLYQQALKAGKRVHKETGINDKAASVSYAGVELARQIFGGLQGKRVLLLGAGEMSELTAKHLHSHGAQEIVVVNRTLERARPIAEKFGGICDGYDKLCYWLEQVDIVISSTGAPHFVIELDHLKAVIEKGRQAPMFLIDIAVPRDIDPRVKDIHNVYAYSIDDLETVVDENMAERRATAELARRIIREEVSEFMDWYNTRSVAPLIAALREKSEDIRQREMEKYQKKLKKLDVNEQEAVDKLTKSLMNSLLKDPLLNLKELAQAQESEAYEDALAQLFDLEMNR